MSVVDEFALATACLGHLRRAYPDAHVVLLADPPDMAALDRWLAYADARTRVVRTPAHVYAVANGGLVVLAHLRAFLESHADWWFKIDPDTLVRRRIRSMPQKGCCFGTIQTREPRPVLQGGCIGGSREAVEALVGTGILESPAACAYEESWAAGNPTVLKRARSGLASFDFIHAWACERAGLPIVDHPEIKSYWLAPPRAGNRFAITHPHKNLPALDPDAPDDVHPLAEQLRRNLSGVVPQGATVAVISRGDDALLELEGREAWHFPRHQLGSYLGHHPADSEEAIAHLQQARRDGAQFLIVPEPSLWWLDHYGAFRAYLDEHCRPVLRQHNVCVAYELT